MCALWHFLQSAAVMSAECDLWHCVHCGIFRCTSWQSVQFLVECLLLFSRSCLICGVWHARQGSVIGVLKVTFSGVCGFVWQVRQETFCSKCGLPWWQLLHIGMLFFDDGRCPVWQSMQLIADLCLAPLASMSAGWLA